MIQATYTGTDGSVWDLRNIPQDGRSVFLTDGGLQGLGFGEFDWFTQSGPITAGQRLTGFRSKERKVVLPVLIGVNLPEDQFLDLSRRWWRANLPGAYGTLTITTSDGLSRSIRMRFQDDGNKVYEDDPADDGSDLYVVTYIADFPFWTSPLVRSTYGADAGQDFYNSGANVIREWTGTPNASTSIERSSAGVRTNLVQYPRGTGGSAYQAGPTMTYGAAVTGRDGNPTTAVRVAYTAGTGNAGVMPSSGSLQVPVGATVSASAWVYVEAGGALASMGWALPGLIAGPSVNVPAGVWTKVTATITNNGTVDRAIGIRNGSAPTTDGTFIVTEMLAEIAPAVGNYFDGNTPNVYGAPPFIISSSSRIVDATIANTGDVPAWGIYTFRGPFDAWWLKVNGGTVGSYALATGETLVVNTNPDVQSAILTRANGTVVDVTPDLPNIDWRPIPVGASVPLQLSFTGTGTIDVDLPALYYRGF